MKTVPEYAVKVLQTLRTAGFEAFFVGGCVRDTLLGRAPKDWDVVVSAPLASISGVFSEGKVLSAGFKHGTLAVLSDGHPVEISAYRAGSTLEEDLAKRDFTMDAMAFLPDGTVLDPFGGRTDLQNGLIRCVGSPEERFREDPLRLLRALRFSAVLGFEIEAGTAAALKRLAPLLRQAAAERQQNELTGLLCGEKAGEVLRRWPDVLCAALPELAPMVGFCQHNSHHDRDVWQHTAAVVENIAPTPVLRWAAFLHDSAKPACFSQDLQGIGHFYGHAGQGRDLAHALMLRLKFSNERREAIELLIARHDTPLEPDKAVLRKLRARAGDEAAIGLLRLQRADNMGQAAAYRDRQKKFDQIEQLLAELRSESPQPDVRMLALRGGDLMKMGLKGRQIGSAQRRLLQAVLENEVPNEPAALAAWLQTHSAVD